MRRVISMVISALLVISLMGVVGSQSEQSLSGTANVSAAADFYVVVSPANISCRRGENVTVTVSVNKIGDFNNTVSLSAENVPSRVDISFTPSSGTPNFSSTVSIHVRPFQTAGDYVIKIRGTYGATVRENTLTLTVLEENNVERWDVETLPSIPPGGSAVILPTGVTVENIRINMKPGQGATDVGIKIADLTNKNAWLPPLHVKEYRYIHIDEENLPAGNVASAEITFTVEKSWLQANNLSPYSVILFRWEGSWVPKPTTLIEDIGTAYRYRAIWPGLSDGGIGGDNNPPSVPVLKYPGNGQTVTSPVTLEWYASTDNEGYVQFYTVIVDNDPNFGSPEVYENTPDNGTSYQVSLTDGTYYWKVRAWDNAGNASDWSASWSFAVITAPPGAYDIEYAQLMATVGVVIDIVIEGDIDWGTVNVNQHNAVPPSPVDNYYIRILDTTTVETDLLAMAENNMTWPGMYLDKPGGDNNIENIQFWKLPIGQSGNENFLIARLALEVIPWLVDLRKPPAGIGYDEYDVFPALSTAVNQLGGTYYGRLTIKAVEST
jgi:PGF-pre-PGF domain-containing protein